MLPAGKQLHRLPLGIGRGITMEIDFATQTGMFLGLYEVELNKHLRELCLPGFNAFDVGGQFGYDALVLAKLSGARVISFECDARACEEMERNVRANPALAGRIAVTRAFIAARTDRGAGALALDDVAFPSPNLSGEGFVPQFMKVDIEGAELDALRGAERILSEARPNVVVETHSEALERACEELLRGHGYRVRVVPPRRWLPDHRPAPHNRWLVAVHA